jgi:acetyl-CoA decarbonylase/synthase complex subunit delta
MTVELMRETWPGRIQTVTIGATPDDGGTRRTTVTVGGHAALPFQPGDAPSPHPPVVALQVYDTVPSSWPEHLGVDLICLRLMSVHPEWGAASPDAAVATVRSVLEAVDVPLIILGCGDAATDNDLWPRVTEAARGERCLVGIGEPDNYKTLVVACMADGHVVIAEAPIDVNIQKQLTILMTEMGLPPERIVMHPGNATLGYGIEYEYSIMERIRLAGLQGDRMLAQPIITIVGEEAWKVKEARLAQDAMPDWGDEARRGPAWETATAAAFLQAGTDIVALVHPEAVASTQRMIAELVTGAE